MVDAPALTIVFFGTPAFAAPALRALLASRHRVVGAVCQPDRPSGRGQKPGVGPVKALAMNVGVPVLQPERLKDPAFLQGLAALRADLGVVAAYGRKLRELAERNSNIVALDGDLMLDCGIIPFKERFPDRFIECGIAEQDMVSQAGGLALKGLLPVVHSFACFLTPRPNEQIYNNAT